MNEQRENLNLSSEYEEIEWIEMWDMKRELFEDWFEKLDISMPMATLSRHNKTISEK
jgi:hypothetical protein